jgi:hypothetical protein
VWLSDTSDFCLLHREKKASLAPKAPRYVGPLPIQPLPSGVRGLHAMSAVAWMPHIIFVVKSLPQARPQGSQLEFG